VSAVERAHPDLRDRVRARASAIRHDDAAESAQDDLIERLWPAAICYAVTAATQDRERPYGNDPWGLLDASDELTLADHFRQVGSTLDVRALRPWYTVSLGAQVIAEVLGFDTDGAGAPLLPL
jgi:hypothetical protein